MRNQFCAVMAGIFAVGVVSRVHADEITCESAAARVVGMMEKELGDELDNYYGDGEGGAADLSEVSRDMIRVCKATSASQGRLACIMAATSLSAMGQCEPKVPAQVAPNPWASLPISLPALSGDGRRLALKGNDSEMGASAEYVELIVVGKTSGQRFVCVNSSWPTDPAPVPPVFVDPVGDPNGTTMEVDGAVMSSLGTALAAGGFASVLGADVPFQRVPFSFAVDGVVVDVAGTGRKLTVSLKQGGKVIGKAKIAEAHKGDGVNLEQVVLIRGKQPWVYLASRSEGERASTRWHAIKVKSLPASTASAAPVAPVAASAADEAIAALSVAADDMCKCKDKLCADRVNADLKKTMEKYGQTKATEAQIKSIEPVMRRFAECLRKATGPTGDSPPGG